MITSRLANEWERRKKQLIEEGFGSVKKDASTLTSQSASQGTSTINYSSSKFVAYSNVVKRLNDARLKGNRFHLAKSFVAELRNLDRDSYSDQTLSCWDCIATIEREDEMDNIFEDNNLSNNYRSSNPTSHSNWNKNLISGSRKYLESSYSKYIDSTITLFPRDALLGGKPSNIDRIRAFLNIRMKRASPTEMQRLDYVDGTPIWACIFYLFRCGFLREAYQFACQYELQLLKSEPTFIAYLKAFIETEDNYLTGTLKAQIQSDYSQRLIVGNQDPFKITLLKILGRCDLNKKTVAEVILTAQDYIWLQLWLVKDSQEFSTPIAPAYDLASLQKLVLELGSKYFNPKGNNNLQYFEILLAVGLFEDAIGYLFDSSSNHQIDAVHFAIALLYHGTINLTPDPDTSDWETVVTLKNPSGRSVSCLNLFKIISIVGKSFSVSDVLDSIQYYLLLALAAPVSPRYNTTCQERIRDAILLSGNFSTILGDLAADGTNRPGLISKFAPLLNLGDERAFVDSITKSAAIKCEKDDKFKDAIHLYNLSGDFEKVLQIVCRKMSQAFAQAYVPGTFIEIYNVGLSIYQFYTQNQATAVKIDRRSLETCKNHIGLLEFKRLVAESHWRQGLQKLEDLFIIPIDGDVSTISQAAERFKGLHDSITANLSEILLNAMTCIYQIFLDARQFVDQDVGRQIEIQGLRKKSRALMIFVGMMQYRVTQEVCAKLTRMDIYMN